MAASPIPSREQEGILHQRLHGGDPTATYDVFRVYLDYLCATLRATNESSISDVLIEEAVATALTAYVKNPASYRPEKGKSLKSYLVMSARGDLLNLWNSEAKHHRGRKSMDSVEHPSMNRNDEVEEDEEDESDERIEAAHEVIDMVCDGLDDGERAALDLFLRGERETARFAAALGIEHLPVNEQKIQVKRVKDKLKKRIERARGKNGESA